VFIAAPLYSQLREGEPNIRRHDQNVLKERERASSVSGAVAPAPAR
jgi:preprotein translocase subunit SecF